MTLTELMIALVLGSLVVLAATAMVVTSRGTYRSQDESTRLAESARFGLELGNRMVRLAGYTNFGDDDTPPAQYSKDALWILTPDSYAFNGPSIVGSNNSKWGGGPGLNGSDSLTIRYFGSSAQAGTADGNVLDCAGNPVPKAPNVKPLPPQTLKQANNNARAYNVLYVDLDTDGEPALKCVTQKYDAATGAPGNPPITNAPQTLIRGVEDFQVLYGEEIPQPLPPFNDLDSYPPQSIAYRTGLGGPNPVVNWENVRTVRIAMLLRSSVGARADPDATGIYHLFGGYPGAGADTGADFSVATLNSSEKTRVRRVVETTVFVRNRLNSWPSLDLN